MCRRFGKNVIKKCEEKRMPYIIIILVLTALDQVTKQIMYNVSGGVQGFSIPLIDKFFHLTYVENHGGVFGLLQGKINFFIINS